MEKIGFSIFLCAVRSLLLILLDASSVLCVRACPDLTSHKISPSRTLLGLVTRLLPQALVFLFVFHSSFPGIDSLSRIGAISVLLFLVRLRLRFLRSGFVPRSVPALGFGLVQISSVWWDFCSAAGLGAKSAARFFISCPRVVRLRLKNRYDFKNRSYD
jgi:hypothetical protein